MYDGDTMTQIFKRTKKCCAKLIRKLTFNTPTTANIPIKLRNSSRYVQQKNKTCNQDNPTIRNSPENSSNTTTATGASKDLARNERLMNGSNGFPDDVLSYEDEDYQMFHISPRFFLKRDMTTSYSRVDNRCKRNCNFPPKLGTSNLMTSMILSRKDLGKFNKSNNNNSSCCSDDEIVTNMKVEGDGSGGDVLFTNDDNKVHNNLSDGSLSPIGNNNNHSQQHHKECNEEKAINRCGTTSPAARPQFIGFDIRNTTWSGYKNETTTSFIVPQNLIEKFDSTMNLNCSFATTPENYSATTAKGNSNKLVQMAKDIGSKNSTQIVFEKVKYDKNKKYLRHTPTNSSIGSMASSPQSLCNGRTLVMLDHSQSSFSLENSFSDNNLYSLVSRSPSNDNNLVWKRCNSSSCDPNGNNCYHPSVNSNPEEAINRINSLRRKYSGTWDSNGNSTDSRRILCDDAWDVFDNKVNNARDKKMMILYPDGEDFIRSSPRSSSTTLETWVDDEIFDNSFNEELERCCTSYER